jgi:hypothetical protein
MSLHCSLLELRQIKPKSFKCLSCFFLALLVWFFVAGSSYLFLKQNTPSINGMKWGGSPLGTLVSRLIYMRSQADWHFGVHESASITTYGTEEKKTTYDNRLLNFFDRLYLASLVPESNAHKSDNKNLENAKNNVVVRLMNLAYLCDPSFGRAIADKAFLEGNYLNNPIGEEKILREGIRMVKTDEERLSLMLMLFFNQVHQEKHYEVLHPLFLDIQNLLQNTKEPIENNTQVIINNLGKQFNDIDKTENKP